MKQASKGLTTKSRRARAVHITHIQPELEGAPEGKRWRRVKGKDGKTVILETKRKQSVAELLGLVGHATLAKHAGEKGKRG